MKEIEVCDVRFDEGLRTRVEKDIMPTIPAHIAGGVHDYSCMCMEKEVKIRRLTPREAWRLMGFTDEDFDKAKKVNTDTQLYKQAGNSIVVQVLEAIIGELL